MKKSVRVLDNRTGRYRRINQPKPMNKRAIFKVTGYSRNHSNANWWFIECQCGVKKEMKASDIPRLESCGCAKKGGSNSGGSRRDLVGLTEFEKMCFREHSRYHDMRNMFCKGLMSDKKLRDSANRRSENDEG